MKAKEEEAEREARLDSGLLLEAALEEQAREEGQVGRPTGLGLRKCSLFSTILMPFKYREGVWSATIFC